ncbi:PH domain-containing protein [Aequorivita marina]|uniref:PH domain-containing protein n=1 Tax=Aequorivita marina TaxID=3073654 RepID=UPI002874D354|nr:PH domain-containing protein [Aequorivita sp. S2608]MDS1296989.1 PH domain-containing protein [Aequorivita sp. S2608]
MDKFTNNSIDIGLLPQFEEVGFQPISKNYLIKVNLQNFLLLCITMIGWGVFTYFEISNTLSIILFILIVLFFVFQFWNTFKQQKNYGFALREKDILFRRGYLVNKTTVVPFNRIQHASIFSDVLDKYLKIATLKIFTAGGSGSDIIIPGLTPDLALRLKEALATKLTEHEL